MPTINRLSRKDSKSTFHSETEMRKLRRQAYNTSSWRKMRIAHIKQHPLCEHCLAEGRVTPADSVHHRRSPFVGGKIDWELFLDDSNLESICATCHGLEHSKASENPEDTLAKLEEMLNNATNENMK